MGLSDEELGEALSERLMAEEDKHGWEVHECLHGFKGAKRIYYVVNPFYDFDDAYYEMYEKEPLEDILLTYAKRNLDDFTTGGNYYV